MPLIAQSWQVFLRNSRVLLRQPAYLLTTLIQPIIWLLLFGALFKVVAHVPGFSGSYIDLLTPGVVVMLAVFSAGWSGMAFVEDINDGVLERLLVTSVRRGALNIGSVVYNAFTVVLQTIVIVLLALLVGADFRGGLLGVVAMLVIAALLAAIFACLSNAVGLSARQRESVIGAVTLVQLPLTFLSSSLMQADLLPHWIRVVAEFNPVNWAVVAARAAAMQRGDWGVVATRSGLLLALLALAGLIAQRTLRAYGRSL
jgi:ABC-2 type transport system permease protein